MSLRTLSDLFRRNGDDRTTDVLNAWEVCEVQMTGEAAAEILRRVMEEAKTDE